MPIALTVALGLANLALLAVIFLKLNDKKDPGRIEDALRSVTADLAERVAKSAGDTREAVTMKLANEFQTLSERIRRELSEGRSEQESRLKTVTETLKGELNAIRDKVDARLMSIGEQVQSKLDKNIQEGFAHFQKVQEHLKNAEMQLQGLNAIG
ncbi:MAG: hypothetical protein AABZ44_03170, partial [Elusimicrobiota bacterium]